MNLKIEILEISPRIKYLKNNQRDIISALLHSGKNITKIYDIEKSIKEKQKISLLINKNNSLKLTLIRNNRTIIGMSEFPVSNEIKWINLYKDLLSNENLLTISSHKIKNENINVHQESSNEKYNNFYLNTNNNTIDRTSNNKHSNNLISAINYADACINNIKIKISMKIDSMPNKKISKNLSLKNPGSLARGSSQSQIVLNISDKNKIINKFNRSNNNNISIKAQKDISQNINSIKLKKKLKNAKSSSSIKIPLNHFINSSKFSLNAIYTNINSNNKTKLNNDNKSLLEKKQKTQYNFNTKKSYLNDENEKNNILNPDYYNNKTITLENNNKKIEDLIIDNNFKNKLKSDEIINPDNFHLTANQTIELNNIISENSLYKTSCTKSVSRINTIKKEISKDISPFNNYNLLIKGNEVIKDKGKKNNSSMNIPDVNFNFPLFNDISKIKKNRVLNPSNTDNFNKNNDDDFVKDFESNKNDIILYYTKEYLNSINDDVLLLEIKMIIEKILNLKIEYKNQYNFLFNNFKNYRKYIKSIQKESIIINKKNNKLQTKIIKNNYLNDYLKIFPSEYRQFISSGKYLIDNNENDFWGNLLNNSNFQNIEDIKKSKMNNIFLYICKKNINNLNSLSKRYYLDIKNKKGHQNRISKEENLSELSALVTIQNNNNETDKEENVLIYNNLYNIKTSKNNKKSKKFYQNLKTTVKDKNRKNQKYNLFLNSKSTEKKKFKKEKFTNKFQ